MLGHVARIKIPRKKWYRSHMTHNFRACSNHFWIAIVFTHYIFVTSYLSRKCGDYQYCSDADLEPILGKGADARREFCLVDAVIQYRWGVNLHAIKMRCDEKPISFQIQLCSTWWTWRLTWVHHHRSSFSHGALKSQKRVSGATRQTRKWILEREEERKIGRRVQVRKIEVARA